jgi:hypothetical protein
MLSFLSHFIAGSPTGADADPSDANANADVRFRFPFHFPFPISSRRQTPGNQQAGCLPSLCLLSPLTSHLALLYPTPPCAALPLLAILSVLRYTAPCAATADHHQLTTMPMRCQTDHAPTAPPTHPPARPLISSSTAASTSARLPSSASPRNPAPRLPALAEPCQPDLLPHRRQRLTSKHDLQRLVKASIHDDYRCLRRAGQVGQKRHSADV